MARWERSITLRRARNFGGRRIRIHETNVEKNMTVISVIVGSTRQGRFSEKPAQWILQHLKKRDGVDARRLYQRNFPVLFFDQPVPPAMPGRHAYDNEVVRRWTAAIAQSDG